MLCRVRFRAIRGEFRTEIFAAAKFGVRNRARSRQNPCRLVVRSFPTIPRGPQHLLRASAYCAACDCVRFGADFGPKFSKIMFAAAKLAVRNRARSRRNSCRLVVHSFLAILNSAKHLLRASACCAACDYVRLGARFWSEIFEHFRGCKILRSKSREIAPKSMPPGGAQLPYDS